jgi:hypothetical protein
MVGHWVRAVSHFAEIESILDSLTDTSGAIVINHKQKVLPQQNKEGQVEYFGKRGTMSLLGAMLIR